MGKHYNATPSNYLIKSYLLEEITINIYKHQTEDVQNLKRVSSLKMVRSKLTKMYSSYIYFIAPMLLLHTIMQALSIMGYQSDEVLKRNNL